MITQITTLKDIGNEKTLRYDVDYIKYHQSHSESYYSFNELFSIVSKNETKGRIVPGDFDYCEIGNSDKNGDINPVRLNFDKRNLEDENYYAKIEDGDIMAVELDDILISKVRPNLKKYIRITPEKQDVYYTTAFIRLKAKEMPDLLYYCLRGIFYEDLMAIARQGKGYPTINEKDLTTLRFNKSVIDALRISYPKIALFIKNTEKRIVNLHSKVKSSRDIIDSIFQLEFGFDYDKFETMKAQRHYLSNELLFSNNSDIRFSARFHRPSGYFVKEELNRIAERRIKDFISEPIVLGASVSPKDYDESGDYVYISMATIKSWTFDKESALTVSNAYSVEKTSKTVRKNDIILARSGEGTIGKVAIITDDELKGVFADFTMRIRLNDSKYNPTFAYYYMRSMYFQYLIEIYKKGLGNNMNIFPAIIQEFPLPSIPLAEQQRIVDEIQAEINCQEQIKAEIGTLRNQISDMIRSTISAL